MCSVLEKIPGIPGSELFMSSQETLTSIGSLNDEFALGDKEKRSVRGCEKSFGVEASLTRFADPRGAFLLPLIVLQVRYSCKWFSLSRKLENL